MPASGSATKRTTSRSSTRKATWSVPAPRGTTDSALTSGTELGDLARRDGLGVAGELRSITRVGPGAGAGLAALERFAHALDEGADRAVELGDPDLDEVAQAGLERERQVDVRQHVARLRDAGAGACGRCLGHPASSGRSCEWRAAARVARPAIGARTVG